MTRAAFGELDWQRFDCADATRRWRKLPNGHIEIEDLGILTRDWPMEVDQWARLIALKALKHAVPASWIAAIMALETGGRPGLCARRSDGTCNTAEGIGLMAMLRSTASSLAGRDISIDELLGDFDLQIDLGAQYIANARERFGDDFVHVALGYNAGSIRCGAGNTWHTPKEPCPPTPWGVVMGCVRASKQQHSHCVPSEIETGKWVCPNLYPEVAIGLYNAALDHGWTDHHLHGAPFPSPPLLGKPAVASFFEKILPFAAGALIGFHTYEFLIDGLRRGR